MGAVVWVSLALPFFNHRGFFSLLFFFSHFLPPSPPAPPPPPFLFHFPIFVLSLFAPFFLFHFHLHNPFPVSPPLPSSPPLLPHNPRLPSIEKKQEHKQLENRLQMKIQKRKGTRGRRGGQLQYEVFFFLAFVLFVLFVH